MGQACPKTQCRGEHAVNDIVGVAVGGDRPDN